MKWTKPLICAGAGSLIFVCGAIAALWLPRFSQLLPRPPYGWKYAGGAEVPSGVAIDGPSIAALRITSDYGSESAEWESVYRRLRPGSVLRIVQQAPFGPEAWRFHFVTKPDESFRFVKESPDTVSLFVGVERRMSAKEEKMRRRKSGRDEEDTKWTITLWGNP